MLNKFYDKFIFTNNLKFKNYNFYLVNLPFAILPIEILNALNLIDDPKSCKAIYSAIKKSTLNGFITNISKKFAFDDSKLIDFVELYLSASGFGKFTNIDINASEKKAIVSLQFNPLAESIKFKTKKASDHVIRGILAGIFSYAFKEDIDCIETKCSAVNANECVFILQKKSFFDLNEIIVREQLPFEI